MIKTAQRKMLRLIVQPKKKKQIKKRCSEQKGEEAEKYADEESKGMSDKETEEGSDQNSNRDQDWIEYIKRSTKEAEEHAKTQDTMQDLNTQKMKWRMARRIASLPEKKMDHESFRLASRTCQQHQNPETGRATQKKMGRRFQRILENRRNTRKDKVRPHEQ